MNPSFWRGKTVFVTGHTGFKGSWLSLWLESVGARVVGYALAPITDPSLFELAEVARGIESHIADVRDAARLHTAVAQARPDVVLHLAAQPLVLESYRDPATTFDTNVMGTVNLLDAVRACPSVRATVVITSDKCYANQEWHWGYREHEPMGGDDPYSASKGCEELVTASYRKSFFSSSDSGWLASARAGNVIGGGDFARDRLITDIMAAVRGGEPVLIRNPEAIRPWQHVLEPLHGYLLLAEALYQHGEPFASGFNFGPADTDARPVRWICDRIVERWGDPASWASDAREHPHEARYLKLDSSLARDRLGWRPRLTLSEALDWIVSWHRAFDDGQDLRAFTLAQIEQYQNQKPTQDPS